MLRLQKLSLARTPCPAGAKYDQQIRTKHAHMLTQVNELKLSRPIPSLSHSSRNLNPNPAKLKVEQAAKDNAKASVAAGKNAKKKNKVCACGLFVCVWGG